MNVINLIPVNAVLTESQIDVDSMLSGDIATEADLTSDISVAADLVTSLTHNYTSDYNLLTNKPQIYSVTLRGNQTLEDVGLAYATNLEIEEILQQ